MEVRSFETQWGGKKLVIETGRYAGQANGACTVRYGDTVVLATATMNKEPREGVDFFPLSVDYEEKLYAAGKIKSSRFIKREGRPSDEAVMTSRMIDRALRPLFPQNMRHEVQVIIECLCVDLENDSDIPALVAASTAVAMSDIPWNGPLGGIRVGRVPAGGGSASGGGGEFIINPTFEARGKGDLAVIVAGTPERVLMIEANANQTTEADMYEAINFGQKHLQEVLDLVKQVVAAVGQPKQDANKLLGLDPDETEAEKKEKADLHAKLIAFMEERFDKVLFTGPKVTKAERYGALDQLEHEADEYLKGLQIGKDKRKKALERFYEVVDTAITRAILERDQRCDGRALNEIRSLSCEVSLLPRTHGSGLFQRGETQILSVITLGGPGDAQTLDGMEEVGKKRYMHHYNFPPFSTGETGRLGGSGRREIGHGGLAERAIMPVLPDKEKFPYTIRIVSEVLSSNGSSSQAAICGSTLSLMDAGVPILAPVAGIAMGLASNADLTKWKVLTDIQDLEDGKGGMDFKVGGTRQGVTTIQLDTKTIGLTPDIIKKALEQGREARLKIIDSIEACLPAPRAEMSPYAPRIVSFKINPEKIREVIGPGGKVINEIVDTCGVTIDIEDDGTVAVCSANAAGLERAVKWIRDITRQVEPGELFKEARITRLMDFGAFAEVLPNQEGLIHISELAPYHVNKVGDLVKIGDIVPVKVIEIDDLGRINLSMKQAKKDLGEEQLIPPGYPIEPERGFGDRGGRGGFGGGHRGGGRGGFRH